MNNYAYHVSPEFAHKVAQLEEPADDPGQLPTDGQPVDDTPADPGGLPVDGQPDELPADPGGLPVPSIAAPPQGKAQKVKNGKG